MKALQNPAKKIPDVFSIDIDESEDNKLRESVLEITE